MENAGLIGIILICGLFADSLLLRQKIKDLTESVEDLAKAQRRP